jgi:hypothetical protein
VTQRRLTTTGRCLAVTIPAAYASLLGWERGTLVTVDVSRGEGGGPCLVVQSGGQSVDRGGPRSGGDEPLAP